MSPHACEESSAAKRERASGLGRAGSVGVVITDGLSPRTSSVVIDLDEVALTSTYTVRVRTVI